MHVKAFEVGAGKHQALQIFDVDIDHQYWRQYALNDGQLVKEQQSYYPGKRAPLPKKYVQQLFSAIAPYLYQHLGLTQNHGLQPTNAVFSVVAKSPQELAINQKYPHIDNTKANSLAIMHYLSEHKHGGTGLFRHKQTGLERINANVEQQYLAATTASDFINDYQSSGYLQGSDSHYELIHRFDYCDNSVVVYPANLLHCGLINAQQDLNSQSPRLTANVFVDIVSK
ncbi:DUF6445 family protein [Paraferrimonas sp. SM1919]|uniref:DUF6445 family protein n=1 Tax=Paraferrimonas sp. SM1919 TaxID=2662263 RepID=UPI0013D5CB91|nr:DUF6445 family protein [Paraferrimonas sp. SM1919]